MTEQKDELRQVVLEYLYLMQNSTDYMPKPLFDNLNRMKKVVGQSPTIEGDRMQGPKKEME